MIAKVGSTPWAALAWMCTIASALLLGAVTGAVGFLGSENNPANLLLAAVVIALAAGTLLARFRPAAMVRVLKAAAAVQIAVAAVALLGQLGSPGWKGLYEAVLGTSLFTALWLAGAWLFGRAATQQSQ